MGPGNSRVARQVGFDRCNRQYRQSHIEGAVGLSWIVDRCKRTIPDGGQAARVANRHEWGQSEPIPVIPAFADDLRADTGGIA
jgi:hypothetical protein